MTKNKLYPWLAWALPALSFMIMYIARVAPAGFLNELMNSLHATHGEVGILGSAFLQGYVLMQLPVGLLVDRFGPVKLILIASLIAIIGNSIFAVSHTLAQAHTARILMGIGSAFMFVCAFKQAKIWLEEKYFPLAGGLTQVFGMLGAAIGTGYLNSIYHDWRSNIILVSYAWLFLLVLMALLLKSKQEDKSSNTNLTSMLSGLKTVLCNKSSWINGLYAGLIFLPTEILGGWWGPYYLEKIHHLNQAESGSLIGLIFVGWALGGSIIGYIAGRWHCVKKLMILAAIFSFASLALALNLRPLPYNLLSLIFFIYGISNSGLVLAYSLATEFVSVEIAGSAVAFTNVMSIILGVIAQPIIGIVVSYLSYYYSEIASFDIAMSALVASLLLAAHLAAKLKI